MGGWRQHHHQQHHQHQQEADRSVLCGPPSAGRALRNRRRIFEDNHQTKRLFTPEIKRFLKGWLVRRRKNPYPNRTEKKELAFKTGLTYIQICNWFANWRRKLKNSSQNTEESWGHLIKDYNNKAKGNVEQFSISSDDSIWDETAFAIDSEQNSTIVHDCQLTDTDHCYYSSTSNNNNNNNDNGTSKQYFDSGTFKENGGCSSSSGGDEVTPATSSGGEEEEEEEEEGSGGSATASNNAEKPPVLLSKWLESAARYRAGTSYVPWAAYNVTWRSPQDGAGAGAGAAPRKQRKWQEGGGGCQGEGAGGRGSGGRRQREELDAAEALTYLSVWHPAAPEPAPTRPITGH